MSIVFAAAALSSAEDRMPPVPYGRTTDARKKAAAQVTAPRGGELPASLVALSRSPEVMVRTKSLGDYVVREKKPYRRA